MLGDTAVAVHPDDERYRHLVGKRDQAAADRPPIPVVADDHVDPEFGTGAVKVTPAHDPNDFEIGRRHGLPMPTIMDETRRHHRARALPRPGPVRGARRGRRARCARRAGSSPRSARTGTASATARAASTSRSSRGCRCSGWSRSGRWPRPPATRCATAASSIHPQEMETRYFDWVDNMHDWCISRQLWWGHRIPVWYGPNGEVVCVGPDDEPPGGAGRRTTTSSTPGSPRGCGRSPPWAGRSETAGPAKYYPTSVLVTGYDILFFWVARMMMFGLYAMDGEPPFDTIALHGMVRDELGKKMSKSAATRSTRWTWMDALRLRRGAVHPGPRRQPGHGRADRRGLGRGLAQLRQQDLERHPLRAENGATVEGPLPAGRRAHRRRPLDPRAADARSARRSTRCCEDFQFAKVSEALYHFAWDEVFDWYVELAKPHSARRRAGAGHPGRSSGRSWTRCCELLHPVVPVRHRDAVDHAHRRRVGRHRAVAGRGGAPATRPPRREIADLQKLVTEVRRFRTEQGLQAGQRVAGRGSSAARRAPDRRRRIRLAGPAASRAGRRVRATATVEVALPGGAVHVALDTSGAIDVAAERGAAGQGPGRGAEGARRTPSKKLGNEAFVAKAPDGVVDKHPRRAGRPRPRTSSGSRRSWRRCRSVSRGDGGPGDPDFGGGISTARTLGDPDSASGIPARLDAADGACPRGRGPCAPPAEAAEDAVLRHVLDAVRGGDNPDVVPGQLVDRGVRGVPARSRRCSTSAGPRRRWSRRSTGSPR